MRFAQLCAARIPSDPAWIPCINREKLKPYRSDPVGSRLFCEKPWAKMWSPQLCAARIPSEPAWIPCINLEKL